MKPTERRLLRQVPGVRAYLASMVAVGIAVAAVVITQASLLAWILARGFTSHQRPAALAWALLLLAAVVGVRGALAWGQGALAQHTAAAVKSRLRDRLLTRTQRLGPVALARWRHGELATLVTRGMDGLDPYFTGYLPKLVAATILPLAVIARLALADWSSALIICVTLPLIPVFAVLVGWHTRDRTARQWALLSRLGGHFLDVVAGLPTLRAFGRARVQASVVRRIADAHRSATMGTLRVAFLSSLVLELVATLSVALVAVPVGLRLMDGGVGLRTALLVLFLAPEAYLPLRAAGAAFHDSMEGVAVAERTFAVLDVPERVDTPDPTVGPVSAATRPLPDPRVDGLWIDQVTARYPARESAGRDIADPNSSGCGPTGRDATGRDGAALHAASLRVRPGERVALVGPSGAGKSTLLALLLGFLTPQSGRVLIGGTDLREMDIDAWRNRLAWVPQHPHLFAGTVADNIRLGRPDAPMPDVREAARAAAADEFISGLPYGYETVLREHGAGVSTGQRQRIALARAFLRDAPLLLLDEPTAHLDPYSEAAVVDASTRLIAGRTALIVAHRPALLPHVDRVAAVRSGQIASFGRCRDVPLDDPRAHEQPAANHVQYETPTLAR